MMNKLTLIALLITSIFIVNHFCQAQCHIDDWTALKAIYESTNGDNWNDNTNWLEVTVDAPTDNCNLGNLYGIHLDNNNRVTCLSLSGYPDCGSGHSGNNLIGFIPREISKLTNLTELYLSGNELSGNIPIELTELNNLSRLWLDSNDLSGSIPPQISRLINLTRISFSMNALSGNIPASIGSLNKLTHLHLVDNNFSGSLPNELGDLTELQSLSLGGNHQLGGSIPASLGKLRKLKTLSLHGNNFSGLIPVELGNLSKLETLNLFVNELSGPIPTSLGKLNNLIYLNLGANNFSGSIPKELGNLEQISGLYLIKNQFSGCYPSELNQLCDRLTHFSIGSGNNFDALWEDFCATGEGVCETPYSVTVDTNYSGNVTITLNNNQNILKNDYVTIYDHSNCPDYNNLQYCTPVIGFNNLAANETLWVVSKAAEYFSIYHNIEMPTISVLVNYEEEPNRAKYNLTNKVIILGSGDGVERNSMSAPDIIGHEYTHAVVSSLKPLINEGISGALNESYGDILGELIEYHCYGHNDWVFGKQAMIPTIGNKTGIRSLSNPKDGNMKYQLPDTYKGDYWVHQNGGCHEFDNCGIHFNNGVHNYWFYLLANGGSGTNDNEYSYNLNGIGIEKAAHITFKNLIENLNPTSNYKDAMLGSIKFASEEYGENSDEVIEVIKAWHAVGINYYEGNPIKWQIVNSKRDGDASITDEGFINKPYTFDLTIDSLGLDMSADKLSFTLHLPHTHRDLALKEIYPPFEVTEVDTSIQNGAMEISINRSNLNAAKARMLRKIKSGSPILGFGVCIVSEDIEGECIADKSIKISGFTETQENDLAFEPAALLVGSDCSNDPNGELINTLGVNIELNNGNCSAFGAIEVEVTNNNIQGTPPYTFELYNSKDLLVDSHTTIDSTYQFYNLAEDEYDLMINDDLYGTYSKKISIDFIAEMDGSNCCPENLTLPVGTVNGIFNATGIINIEKGTTVISGDFEICE